MLRRYFSLFAFRFKFDRGFTLVEALVAITIVLFTVVGPLTIVSKNLAFARSARDQITAFYLGQEAVEFVRNTRDNNSHVGDDWLTGLDACISGTCIVDSPAGTVASCGASCDPLKLSSSGIYGYLAGVDTLYTREVSINEISDGREATIDVTVRWSNGSLQRDFTIREHILNWQQGSAVIVQADFLTVDLSQVAIDRDRRIVDIFIENVGVTPISIAAMTLTWTDTDLLIRRINFNDFGTVWDEGGPGSPSGQQPSGTRLDIVDVFLAPGSGPLEIRQIRFSSDILGTTFTIIFEMVDGSVKSTGPFTPAEK